ncbi:MAG: hypothetical protein ABI876_15860 [Bacteroidota bacterium]
MELNDLPLDIAIYAEYSDRSKPMVHNQPPLGDWNVRVFNRIEVQGGENIRLVKRTGAVILKPGLYQITASSLVTYYDPNDPDQKTVLTRLRPFGGYCRLRYLEDAGCLNEQAIAIGTISTANMSPSLIDTWLLVKEESSIVLEHQVGANVENLYLQIYVVNSTWHVFARISIRRV